MRSTFTLRRCENEVQALSDFAQVRLRPTELLPMQPLRVCHARLLRGAFSQAASHPAVAASKHPCVQQETGRPDQNSAAL